MCPAVGSSYRIVPRYDSALRNAFDRQIRLGSGMPCFWRGQRGGAQHASATITSDIRAPGIPPGKSTATMDCAHLSAGQGVSQQRHGEVAVLRARPSARACRPRVPQVLDLARIQLEAGRTDGTTDVTNPPPTRDWLTRKLQVCGAGRRRDSGRQSALNDQLTGRARRKRQPPCQLHSTNSAIST